eukprot:CAMPEP_0176487670 /NCGR_PEP_ID=MMETSP0200_2-20121128/6271_1 /TAXON_ID=947934 /ORGANISM="Chaetoceros sp., Strain GSL56" /LENGTH=288 /DNA_ID=CAMNT_0017884545 /DNA_START=14 /DNA_END=880 /DNA_ORIENTATION=-
MMHRSSIRSSLSLLHHPLDLLRLLLPLLLVLQGITHIQAYTPSSPQQKNLNRSNSITTTTTTTARQKLATPTALYSSSRKAFLQQTFLTTATAFSPIASSTFLFPSPSHAVGPVKLKLQVQSYTAKICPPDRPIPGEKAMKGMKGLCVTVVANVLDEAPKELEKVGVYGFVVDGVTGDSVLANNPDLSTDAGQFAMVPKITPKTKQVEFEFIAAVPKEKDLSAFENGIGPLDFEGLRVVSYPGGQQYGAVNPCEMNEFSEECEAWEEENGPYQKGEFMMKSNARTKGR